MAKPLRILIVDDDLYMAHTLADILAVSGYSVMTSLSAEDGLRKLEAAPFDCVVSDIRMPGMNGVEFQQAIREKFGKLPVMLITAYADYNLIVQARAQGVDAFLEKPLDIARTLLWLDKIALENSISGEL